jgi:hypothetical protein
MRPRRKKRIRVVGKEEFHTYQIKLLVELKLRNKGKIMPVNLYYRKPEVLKYGTEYFRYLEVHQVTYML